MKLPHTSGTLRVGAPSATRPINLTAHRCVVHIRRAAPTTSLANDSLSNGKSLDPHPRGSVKAAASQDPIPSATSAPAPDGGALVPGETTFGEDAAAFDIEHQSLKSWGLFFALLTGVTALLYGVWIAPGIGVGEDFVAGLQGLFENSEATMIAILVVFAIVHSGLAYLRPYGEEVIGARAYRVVFALASLPLAVAAVVFFINHRYDGIALWNIR